MFFFLFFLRYTSVLISRTMLPRVFRLSTPSAPQRLSLSLFPFLKRLVVAPLSLWGDSKTMPLWAPLKPTLNTKPLNITVSSLCKAKQIPKAKTAIVDGIRLGLLPDAVTYNPLIDAYCRFATLDVAYSVLAPMHDAGIPHDIVSFNMLISGAVRKSLFSKSLDLFDEMLNRGIWPDAWSHTILMHCNGLSLFRNLQRHGFVPQVLTYNALINGLCKARRLKDSRKVMKEFGEYGYEPDAMRSLGFAFDGFAYCMVIAAMIKTGRMQEAEEIFEMMGRLDDVLRLLDEIEGKGLECDQYTHTIIVDGLCQAGNFVGAQRHLNYMNTLGFGYNLVAFNCLLNGLGKVGYIDHALRLFKVMEVKDSFTYTIVVHNLCRAKQFLCASKVLVSCLKCGYQVLRATQREVIVCLQSIGYANEARRVKSRIRLAQFVP
ncbi:Putative pentatricopeptide repeat-containing protein [Glycine soja]|uniref:Putative pentatricopeptide repeat-containing protein n=1 Tax=Glycine soja TaxID=3848 RepID=A0A0B2QXD6_GLYSO|nr:Putative pentatricopeptide repeat-containing protein [Glycine soja]